MCLLKRMRSLPAPFAFPASVKFRVYWRKSTGKVRWKSLCALAFWNSSAPLLSNPTIEITVRTATEHS